MRIFKRMVEILICWIACPIKVLLYSNRTRRKNDFQGNALDPHNRSRSCTFLEWILDILLWFYSNAERAALGLFGNYIHSRRMFLLRIIARATTPIFFLSLSLLLRRPHTLLFSRWSPLCLWIYSFSSLATLHFPVKFRRCSLKSAS